MLLCVNALALSVLLLLKSVSVSLDWLKKQKGNQLAIVFLFLHNIVGVYLCVKTLCCIVVFRCCVFFFGVTSCIQQFSSDLGKL